MNALRPPGAGERIPLRISVLRGFELRAGDAVLVVPPYVERVLAFLAVRERPQLRSTVATTLWLDSTDDRAAANLRTALWKARQTSKNCVTVTGNYLALGPLVEVDVAKLLRQARRLVGSSNELGESDTDTHTLLGDLLPGWDEEWIMFERERVRQLRVHALEALCQRLSSCGRHAEAIDAGLAAVAAEPLRESAQRALIQAHLAEGNVCEAKRQYQLYSRLLHDEMGLQPTYALRALVGVVTADLRQRDRQDSAPLWHGQAGPVG